MALFSSSACTPGFNLFSILNCHVRQVAEIGEEFNHLALCHGKTCRHFVYSVISPA